jgi:biotin---protein ligase
LGLRVSKETSSIPQQSNFHLSSVNPLDISLLLEDLKDIITIEGGEEYIKGGNDTFHIEKESSRWSKGSLVKPLAMINSVGAEDRSGTGQHNVPVENRIIDYGTVLQSLIPYENNWPGAKETPFFNHHEFFANLRRYQQEYSSEAEEFGHILMYGEVLNSTNTILEK